MDLVKDVDPQWHGKKSWSAQHAMIGADGPHVGRSEQLHHTREDV